LHPLLYDIRRTFLSKSVLILMAVLIIISLAVVPSFRAISVPPPQNSGGTLVLTYYDSGGNYHFIAFAWNQFGQKLSQATFQVNLSSTVVFTQFKGPEPSGSIYQGPLVTTNSSGEAQFAIKAPVNQNYSVFLLTTQPNGSTFSPFPQYLGQPYGAFVNGTSLSVPAGEVVGLNGGSGISSVTDSSDSSRDNVQVIWAGSNGTIPTNYALYYKFINSTTVCQNTPNGQECFFTGPDTSGLNESNMQLLGTMNSYQQIFSTPKLWANLSSDSFFALGLFYPNRTAVAPVIPYSVSEFYPQAVVITPPQGNSIVVNFFESIFGLVIPLIAIIGSYNSYGKDRVSGILESVLAQPVSRRGLSISRYVSSFIAMAIAVAISVAVLDLIARSFTGAFVDSNIILASTGAFFVELAAFMGIMMLLSHLTKSSGALIGIGIGLFIVIDFFWSIILTLATNAANIPFYSTGFFQVFVIGQFANPAEFVALVITYLTHNLSLVGFSTFGLTVTPSQYGITIPAIVATGILWVVAPLAIFLYLAIKRD
jgi:ABC-2 type transport system permease protein